MTVQSALFRAVGDFSGLRGQSSSTRRELARLEAQAEGTFGRGFQRGLRQTQAGMEELGATMTVGVTAPIVGLGVAAVNTFKDFDQAIVQAGLKAGATEKQIESMRQTALKMGTDTKFSATEAALAMDELAANGLNAKEAIGALPGVTKAAQAANADLAVTAGIVSSAMNAFNLTAEDTVHIADVMTQAANTSAIDMIGLGEALAHAGQLGATANQDLEDVVAVISRLTNLGVPAAQAGVALRQGMTSLQAPTKKAAKLIDQLGLELRDASGEMLPLPDIIENLSNSFKNPTAEVKELMEATGRSGAEFEDYAMKTLFGVEGAKAFGLAIGDTKPLILDAATDTKKLIALQDGLAETMGEKGSKAWIAARMEGQKFVAKGPDIVRSLAAMNKGADGVADSFGERFSKTLGSRLEQFQGGLETLAIKLVTLVLPYLLTATDYALKFTDAIIGFADANPEIAKMVVGFLALLAVIGPVLLIGSKVVGFIAMLVKGAGFLGKVVKTVVVNLRFLAAAMGIGLGPLTLIILGIAALVIGFILLWKRSDKFRRFWIGMWEAIKKAAVYAWERGIKPAFWATVKFFKDELIPMFMEFWKKVAVPAFKYIAKEAQAMWRVIKPPLMQFGAFVRKNIGPALRWLWKKVAAPSFKSIGRAISFLWFKVVKPAFKFWVWYMRTVVGPALKFLWEAVKWNFRNMVRAIKYAWKWGIKPAFDAIKWGVGKVKDGFDLAVKGIKKAWAGLKAAVRAPVVVAIKIINEGLIKPFNWLAGKLGVDTEIDEIQPPKFAGGGEIPGKNGSRRADNVLMWGTAGEEVIRQASAQKLRRKQPGLLEYLNKYGEIPRHAGGGTVWPAVGDVAQHSRSQYPWAVWAGDINVPGDETGNPVRAYRSGTVASTALWEHSYGHHIRLNHGDQNTLYAHLSEILVAAGEQVTAGQIIGRVGGTGNVTGPHLHFEIMGGSANLSGSGGGGNPLAALGGEVMSFVSNPLGYLNDKISDGLGKLRGHGPMGELAAGVPAAAAKMFASAAKNLGAGFIKGEVAEGLGSLVKNPVKGADTLLNSVFDDGGVARGRGFMPKGTLHPERVLNAQQTRAFDALVAGILGPAPVAHRVVGPGANARDNAGGGIRDLSLTWIVHNPKPETATESSLKTLTKVAQEGLVG